MALKGVCARFFPFFSLHNLGVFLPPFGALGVLPFVLCFGFRLSHSLFFQTPFLCAKDMQTDTAGRKEAAVEVPIPAQAQAAATQSLLSLAAKCQMVAEQEGISPSPPPSQSPAKQGSEAAECAASCEHPTTPQKKPVGEKKRRKEHEEVCDESLEEAAKRVFLYLHQRESTSFPNLTTFCFHVLHLTDPQTTIHELCHDLKVSDRRVYVCPSFILIFPPFTSQVISSDAFQDVLNVMGAVPNESTPIVRRERIERKARGAAKSATHRYVFCDSATWPEGVTLSTLEVDYRQLAHHLQVLGAKIDLLHRVLSNHPEQFVHSFL